MLKNKKTSALAPMLVGGVRVLTAPSGTTAGTAATTWASYSGWTTSITDFATLASATTTSLIGTDDDDKQSTTGLKPGMGTEVTCDTTKWASDTACNGINRWGFGATTEWSSSTSLGSKRAWLFLSDKATHDSAIFSVTAGDEIQISFYQYRTWS